MLNERRSFLKSAVAASSLLVIGKAALAGDICAISPAQTKGPFVPDDFPFRDVVEGHPYVHTQERDADLTITENGKGATGQTLYLRGQIVDESCRPVPFAQVFLWQADDHGHYNHSEDPNINTHQNPLTELDENFQYRGVVTTDKDGRFQFKTIKPKYYPLDPSEPDFKRTAHIHFGIMKDGFQSLFTQAYFEGDLLEDIQEIRRLNKIDILLGKWVGSGANARPTGEINPVFLPLIVNYRDERGWDAPVGDIRFSIRRR